MSFGIQTFNASGNALFDSDVSQSYFHLASTVDTYSSLSETAAVASAREQCYGYLTGTSVGIRTTPRISGNTLYNPSPILNGYQTGTYCDSPATSTTITPYSAEYFGRATQRTSGYGFSCIGADGLVQISDLVKHSSVIASGTATAQSIPTPDSGSPRLSTYPWAGRITEDAYTTITFPAQDTPPLIFVTTTNGGWLALHSFVFDSNGKCVGAAIVSPTAWSGYTGGSTQDKWYSGSFCIETSCEFSYFVVNAPSVTSSEECGFQVMNANGEITFDHAVHPLIVPSIITP